MTEPLVPADVVLRDFAFMPLDVVRLRDSSLAIEASGDEFRAAVLLWCVAWHQIPAASLPDDDRALAMYAGFGRDVKGWKQVRDGALRGFVKCSDGRLYHPVLAEKAFEAAGRKGTTDNKSARQQRWRERSKELCEKLRELGVTPPSGASLEKLETLLVDAMQASTGDARQASTVDATSVSHGPSTETSGQGQGQGQGEDKDQELFADARAPAHLATRFAEFWEAYPNKTGKKPCEAKWKLRKLDRVADLIIADVRRRKLQDRRWLEGFVPNPETYLNQDRWNDELPTTGARQRAADPDDGFDHRTVL